MKKIYEQHITWMMGGMGEIVILSILKPEA